MLILDLIRFQRDSQRVDASSATVRLRHWLSIPQPTVTTYAKAQSGPRFAEQRFMPGQDRKESTGRGQEYVEIAKRRVYNNIEQQYGTRMVKLRYYIRYCHALERDRVVTPTW
jgi:hypothetical protein